MAGLVGVISHRRTVALPEAELDALVEAFGHVRGMGAQRRQRVADWAHLATIDVGAPATVAVAGESWLAAVGAIHSDGPLAQTIVEDLDGQFAGVRHDADAGSVEVFSDPFGMQALYTAVRDGRTYISTSAAALARHLAAAPDELGIRVFLRSGYQIGPATHWTGVERVEPGTCLAFTDGDPRRRVYWLPQVDERVRAMTLEQAADHCTEVALDVFRRRLGGGPRSWLDLTGGFDSRMVAGAAARAEVPFVANTSGEPGDVDVELARRVAEAAGFQWQRIGVGPDWAADATVPAAGGRLGRRDPRRVHARTSAAPARTQDRPFRPRHHRRRRRALQFVPVAAGVPTRRSSPRGQLRRSAVDALSQAGGQRHVECRIQTPKCVSTSVSI